MIKMFHSTSYVSTHSAVILNALNKVIKLTAQDEIFALLNTHFQVGQSSFNVAYLEGASCRLHETVLSELCNALLSRLSPTLLSLGLVSTFALVSRIFKVRHSMTFHFRGFAVLIFLSSQSKFIMFPTLHTAKFYSNLIVFFSSSSALNILRWIFPLPADKA